MSQFLYYMPGIKLVTPEAVEKAGMSYALDGATVSSCGVHGGPDGGDGAIFICHPNVKNPECPIPQVGYYPDKQTWKRAGKIWIGIDKDCPPAPQGLARPTALDGHFIELKSGPWLVPVARHFYPDWGSPLPQVFGMDENGELDKKIDAQYTEFCKGADRAWYWFCKDFELDDFIVDAPEIERTSELDRIKFACEAIGLNYRVGMRELLALQEITTIGLGRIEQAIFDWRAVELFNEVELKKNNEADALTPRGSTSGTASEGGPGA